MNAAERDALALKYANARVAQLERENSGRPFNCRPHPNTWANCYRWATAANCEPEYLERKIQECRSPVEPTEDQPTEDTMKTTEANKANAERGRGLRILLDLATQIEMITSCAGERYKASEVLIRGTAYHDPESDVALALVRRSLLDLEAAYSGAGR